MNAGNGALLLSATTGDVKLLSTNNAITVNAGNGPLLLKATNNPATLISNTMVSLSGALGLTLFDSHPTGSAGIALTTTNSAVKVTANGLNGVSSLSSTAGTTVNTDAGGLLMKTFGGAVIDTQWRCTVQCCWWYRHCLFYWCYTRVHCY